MATRIHNLFRAVAAAAFCVLSIKSALAQTRPLAQTTPEVPLPAKPKAAPRAETEAEIRAKISRLEAEIVALKARLPKPALEDGMLDYRGRIIKGKTSKNSTLCISPSSL